jgi:hypothetical protein
LVRLTSRSAAADVVEVAVEAALLAAAVDSAVEAEVLARVVDSLAAVAQRGLQSAVRRRSVVRVVVSALRRGRRCPRLGPARERDRGQTSGVEMSERAIGPTSVPERDRGRRRHRRHAPALDQVKVSDRDKELRIDPERVRASPLDPESARDRGSQIVRASPIHRRGCRDSVTGALARVCRIKEPIGRRRLRVGAAS